MYECTKFKLNQNGQNLMKEYLSDKKYDSITSVLKTTKQIEDTIYHTANALDIEFDDAANFLIMIASYHLLYDEPRDITWIEKKKNNV